MQNEENDEKESGEDFEELEPSEAAKLIASRLTRAEMVSVAMALDIDIEDGDDEFYDTFQEETRKIAPEIFDDSGDDEDESSESGDEESGESDDDDE